jgi:hypothetical protein
MRGHDRPGRLRAEPLLLQAHARGRALRTDPRDGADDRPALRMGDLLAPAPPMDALPLGERRGIKRRGERALGAAQLDVRLAGAPAPQRGHPEEMVPRPRRGILGVCGHPDSSSGVDLCESAGIIDGAHAVSPYKL